MQANLSAAQIAVALDWWAGRLTAMYNVSDEQVALFHASLGQALAGRRSASVDARIALPGELRPALELVGIGDNARQRMKAHMCFPNGGVLVCDGAVPDAGPAPARRQKLADELPVFVRSSVDALPVSLLLPFGGTVVWEQSAWYCDREYVEAKTSQRKRHDKVWAACLVAVCAQEETLAGMQPCLKWEYHARYGPRLGTLSEQVVRFEADAKETAQQKAAARYRAKVREQARDYEPIAFDDQERRFQIPSFVDFLINAAFAA